MEALSMKEILKCNPPGPVHSSFINAIYQDHDGKLLALCGTILGDRFYIPLTEDIYSEIEKHKETHWFSITPEFEQCNLSYIDGIKVMDYGDLIKLEKTKI